MRYRASQSLTECVSGLAVRLQLMNAGHAPRPSIANHSMRYSGQLGPSRATISPGWMSRSFSSQLPTGWSASKNCLYVHCCPSNSRKRFSPSFVSARSSKILYTSILSWATLCMRKSMASAVLAEVVPTFQSFRKSSLASRYAARAAPPAAAAAAIGRAMVLSDGD